MVNLQDSDQYTRAQLIIALLYSLEHFWTTRFSGRDLFETEHWSLFFLLMLKIFTIRTEQQNKNKTIPSKMWHRIKCCRPMVFGIKRIYIMKNAISFEKEHARVHCLRSVYTRHSTIIQKLFGRNMTNLTNFHCTIYKKNEERRTDEIFLNIQRNK